jgi:RNA polymerase sigma-70 factor (ECF subfamily)
MSGVVAIDEVTVAAFRRGDETAVRRFYETYGRMMFAVASRILRDPGHAEEATQQAFVQAWRAASSLDSTRDPAPWLATIVRRVAIDIQRREARRPASALDQVHPGHSALTVLPLSAEQAWEAWNVRSAIDQLPADEREIVRLQHLEGFTHVQIAERLGVALGTVKSRSFRAHRTLAARLAHLRTEAG